MFKNQKIFILGMARSGYEVAKVLAKRNNEIIIIDEKEQDEMHVSDLEELNVTFIKCKKGTKFLNKSFDYVIKNPGIKLDHPLILKARRLNIPVINEVEVAYNLLPKDIKIIGVTGSNGKTTTTTMIYEILKKAGFDVLLGGNIGYPVCSLLDKINKNSILVLEISSHQLHDLKNFKTNISVMTNLSEVHLDHFGSYEFYKEQKFKIFKYHNSENISILNYDNKDIMENISFIKSNKLYFSSKRKCDIYLNKESIYYKNKQIIKLKDIFIKGVHNYENVMCAIGVVKEFNVKNKIIKEYLKEFKGVEHRIEFVRDVNGVKFYNDSKSTNPESTIVALKTFSENIILILGGLDRGQCFESLNPYLNKVKFIICYGEVKERVRLWANANNVKVKIFENVNECVKFAYEKGRKNDVVLLSPACASWDQYKDYIERGNDFKESVKLL